MSLLVRRRGSLLVVTLWLIVVLAMVAIALSRYLSTETRLTRYQLARAQARAFAKAGIYLAMQRLAQDVSKDPPEEYDWLGDEWAYVRQDDPAADPAEWVVPFPPEGEVSIRIMDEERKLNLNVVEKLRLTALGVPDAVAEAIIDYRDPDGDDPAIVPPYAAKNARIVTPEEIRDIPGATEGIYTTLEQSTSVWLESHAKLNINTAGRKALEALGLGSLVEAILGFREQGHYFVSLTPDVATENLTVPVPFDPGVTEFQNVRDRLGVSSQTFRVKAEGKLRKPMVQYQIEAILRRGESGTQALKLGEVSFNVLAWREG